MGLSIWSARSVLAVLTDEAGQTPADHGPRNAVARGPGHGLVAGTDDRSLAALPAGPLPQVMIGDPILRQVLGLYQPPRTYRL
jgi:hypothetical protein